MCGIAGIYVKKPYIGKFPVDELASQLLYGIEHRGKHATGVVAVNSRGQITLQKAAVTATQFNMQRNALPADLRMALLHTRYATKGRPEDFENNHPVVHGTCFATHNGQIRNDDAIVEQLAIGRPAAVDSIAIPMVLHTKGLAETDSIREGLEMLQGPLAVAAIDPINCPGKLVLAKGDGNPLWVLNHKQAIVWASTKGAIEDAWGNVIGTPPKKTVSWSGDHPDDPRKSGVWYCFKWGDLWIIEDDKIDIQRWQQPSAKYERSTGFHAGWFPDSDDEYDSCGTDRHGYVTRPSEKRNFLHTKTWLCHGKGAHAKVCAVAEEHRCSNCVQLSCKCYKSEYTYTDPAPWGEDDPNGSDDPVADALIRCDGCMEWFGAELMADEHWGTTTMTMCEDCRLDQEWNEKSNDEDTARAKRWQRVARRMEREEDEIVVMGPTEKEKVMQDKQLDLVQEISESAEQRHQKVCGLVAQRHKCDPDFVNYLCFQASDDEITDQVGDLIALRCTFEDDYAEFMRLESAV